MQKGVDYIGVSIAFFCHDGSGNFVLHKRSSNCRDEQGRWDFGGGSVKFGETLEEALWREIKEEYGCSGTLDVALPPDTYLRTHGGVLTHWITHPYIVSVDRAEVTMNEPESMEELGWFTIRNLPDPLHSGVIKDLENHKKVFEKYTK